MRHEAEIKAEAAGEDFKANIFASNPKLYFELFEKKQQVSEEDIHFPQTPEEFNALVSQMKRDGVVDSYSGDRVHNEGDYNE